LAVAAHEISARYISKGVEVIRKHVLVSFCSPCFLSLSCGKSVKYAGILTPVFAELRREVFVWASLPSASYALVNVLRKSLA